MATQVIPGQEIPDVPVLVERRGHIWLLHIDECPFCGEPHMHGGGDGKKPDAGYRRSHCSGLRQDYRLVLPERPGLLERIFRL